MIPKKIHYCWFGPKRMPRTVRRCIETWHQLMPDYEFMLWNESNSPMEHPFVTSAYAAKKYAFVADYVRFWALYNYGGIYLDTDMYVVKRFDDLLNNEFFAGYENKKDINVAIVGSKKHNTLTYQILTIYDSLSFENTPIKELVVPHILTPHVIKHPQATIYPYDYFYSLPYEERFITDKMKYMTHHTYAIHLWNISWGKMTTKILNIIFYYIQRLSTFFYELLRMLGIFYIKVRNLRFFQTAIYLGQYASNRNFGDALGLILVKEIPIGRGIAIPQRLCFNSQFLRGTNLQMAGSTIEDVDSNSIICGAGAVSKNIRIKNTPSKILFVRGPLTKELLEQQGISCPNLFGDPALLLPLLYQPHVVTYNRIGIIPHYVDQQKTAVGRLLCQNDAYYIDILLSKNKLQPSIYKEWKPWIDNLCACKTIISSSLHGLIIGDAYGLPTLWVKFGDEINGDDFKYYDYYASLGIYDIQPIIISPEENTSLRELSNQATIKNISMIKREELLKALKLILSNA